MVKILENFYGNIRVQGRSQHILETGIPVWTPEKHHESEKV